MSLGGAGEGMFVALTCSGDVAVARATRTGPLALAGRQAETTEDNVGWTT